MSRNRLSTAILSFFLVAASVVLYFLLTSFMEILPK